MCSLFFYCNSDVISPVTGAFICHDGISLSEPDIWSIYHLVYEMQCIVQPTRLRHPQPLGFFRPPKGRPLVVSTFLKGVSLSPAPLIYWWKCDWLYYSYKSGALASCFDPNRSKSFIVRSFPIESLQSILKWNLMHFIPVSCMNMRSSSTQPGAYPPPGFVPAH